MSEHEQPDAAGEGTTAGKAIQRVTVTVVHQYDGELRTDIVTLKPVALVAAERHYKGQVPPVEGTIFAAHWLLSREQRGLELAPFGTWLEEHLEAIEEELGDPIQAPPVAP